MPSHISLCPGYNSPLKLTQGCLSPLPRGRAEVPKCNCPWVPSASWSTHPTRETCVTNLNPSHNLFLAHTLILEVVTHLDSGEEECLGHGDPKLQGLLLSPVERFDLKTSPRMTPSKASASQEGQGPSLPSAHCWITDLQIKLFLLSPRLCAHRPCCLLHVQN
jgi:hypothetical protein